MPDESALTRLCMIRNASVARVHWPFHGLPFFYVLLFGFQILSEHVEGLELLSCWRGAVLSQKLEHCLALYSRWIYLFHPSCCQLPTEGLYFFSLSLSWCAGTLYHVFPELPRRKVWPRRSHLLLGVPGLEELPEGHVWCQGTLQKVKPFDF